MNLFFSMYGGCLIGLVFVVASMIFRDGKNV
jgi:hypothetical protein